MQKKIDVSIAPGVCTKYIQAVDVSWKKASKVLATEKLRPVVSRGRNQPVKFYREFETFTPPYYCKLDSASMGRNQPDNN